MDPDQIARMRRLVWIHAVRKHYVDFVMTRLKLFSVILFLSSINIFQGFVIVEDFFDKKLLDDCREAVNELVEQLAQKLFKAGKIKGMHTCIKIHIHV
jgi:hypothetical protein